MSSKRKLESKDSITDSDSDDDLNRLLAERKKKMEDCLKKIKTTANPVSESKPDSEKVQKQEKEEKDQKKKPIEIQFDFVDFGSSKVDLMDPSRKSSRAHEDVVVKEKSKRHFRQYVGRKPRALLKSDR